MSRFNAYSALVIVPLLARVVLCAAFMTAGWTKLMHTQEFTGDAARILLERGFVEMPRAAATPAAWVPAAVDDASPPAAAPAAPAPPRANDANPPIPANATVEAKRLHNVTVMLVQKGFQGRVPGILAWSWALVELVGGTLLLVGLFSRIWALGLVVIIGSAFYASSFPLFADPGVFGIAADMTNNYGLFHQVYAQLGLLVLALCVMLAGPGPVSLDRLIFRPSRTSDQAADLPD